MYDMQPMVEITLFVGLGLGYFEEHYEDCTMCNIVIACIRITWAEEPREIP